MTEDLPGRVRAMLDGRIPPPDSWRAIESLVAGLTPSERGDLLPVVWRLENDPGTGSPHLHQLAGQIDNLRHPTRISPAALADAIAALQDIRSRPGETPPPHMAGYSADEVRDHRIGLRLWRLARCAEALPAAEAVKGLRSLLPLLDSEPGGGHARMVAAAGFAGLPEVRQEAVDRLLADLKGDLAVEEWGLFLTLPPLALRDWVVLNEGRDVDAEPADHHAAQMRFLDETPFYREFAPKVVAIARARLSAIAGKRTAYRADGAFPVEDCAVIERAVLWGLARNAGWCLDALEPLWLMAVQAPDPKAKTMPSQSLSIRFANAAATEPRPEALRALDAAAAACRHAGVAKKLKRARGAARSALVAMPERMLSLDPATPLAKDMLKPFAIAVEALLSQPESMPATVWSARFGPGRKEGWALAKDLVWQVAPAGNGAAYTALPGPDGGWRDCNGKLHDYSDADLIRLWHPADTPAELSRAWRGVLERQGVQQPFLQAMRETYPPSAAERATNRTAMFAGCPVAATPLIGLARVSGWRLGYESELHLTLGGRRFMFDAGVRVYPGAGGEGETGSFFLAGPEASFADIPPRVVSEALRKVKLLVTIGERGLK
ncbi:MAG: DUF4132 domain-containing protein [Pikeienuella sp.]